MPPRYRKELGNRFVEIMRGAGFDPVHYQGSGFYQGPAVRIDRANEIKARAAAHKVGIIVNSDQLGDKIAIFPSIACGKPIGDF